MMKLIRTITATKEDRSLFLGSIAAIVIAIVNLFFGLRERNPENGLYAAIGSIGLLAIGVAILWFLCRTNRPDPNDPLEQANQRIAKMRQP